MQNSELGAEGELSWHRKTCYKWRTIANIILYYNNKNLLFSSHSISYVISLQANKGIYMHNYGNYAVEKKFYARPQNV